jgi:SPP1 gp7 family putative phage head morphogenesis protein
MIRRFKAVSKAITELVVRDDAFGLGPVDGLFRVNESAQEILKNQQVPFQAWKFQTDAQKVRSYRRWLKKQVDANILTPVGGISGKPWTAPYIESVYRKGAIRAYTDLRSEDLAIQPTVFLGGREEFIRQAFGTAIATQKIESLYTRAFTELEGITAAMDQQMSRILADGLSQGHGARKVAKALRENVTKMTKQRAIALARTELVRAHAEGQLDAYERLGEKEVGVMAEWITAGDERVCELCLDLEGVVMTIKEARGTIPRHVNCRCAWIPADRVKREKGQKRGKAKKAAIRKSIKSEGGLNTKKRSAREIKQRSTWVGKELV